MPRRRKVIILAEKLKQQYKNLIEHTIYEITKKKSDSNFNTNMNLNNAINHGGPFEQKKDNDDNEHNIIIEKA